MDSGSHSIVDRTRVHVSADPKTNSFTKRQPGSQIGNLFFQDSVNIGVVGVRITSSGFWTQTFRRCNNVLVELVTVEGSVQWGTGDGTDVESGYNLTFRESAFKTGDDCLAFRSGSFLTPDPPWPAGRSNQFNRYASATWPLRHRPPQSSSRRAR
jgi:polygalacturonase